MKPRMEAWKKKIRERDPTEMPYKTVWKEIHGQRVPVKVYYPMKAGEPIAPNR